MTAYFACCLLGRSFVILYVSSHPKVSFNDKHLDCFSMTLSAHSILLIFTIGLRTIFLIYTQFSPHDFFVIFGHRNPLRSVKNPTIVGKKY